MDCPICGDPIENGACTNVGPEEDCGVDYRKIDAADVYLTVCGMLAADRSQAANYFPEAVVSDAIRVVAETQGQLRRLAG